MPDVTRCLAKISDTFPLGIFNLTGSMRSFARFMAEKHPELPDISPALVFSAAKRRRVYVGYTHEDAQKIFSAINRAKERILPVKLNIPRGNVSEIFARHLVTSGKVISA